MYTEDALRLWFRVESMGILDLVTSCKVQGGKFVRKPLIILELFLQLMVLVQQSTQGSKVQTERVLRALKSINATGPRLFGSFGSHSADPNNPFTPICPAELVLETFQTLGSGRGV